MALALAIHGGAGTILKSKMTPDLEHEYRAGLETGLKAGWSILEAGGSSLDAVEAAVASLEDFPLFNAGRGSVFTHEGKQEMDAAIMDGANLKAGSVAFVKNIKNPIKLARLVMERTEHVLLAGEGANQFAEQMGIRTEPDEYFFTEHRWLQLQEAMAAGRAVVATRVGGCPELIDDAVSGLLVPPRDPPALAAALGRLLRDPLLMQDVGRAARRTIAERFSSGATAAAWDALYRRLADAPAADVIYLDARRVLRAVLRFDDFFALRS